MQIPVLIEPVAGNGYRAAAFNYSVEGASKEEAIEKLKKLLKERIAEGRRL